MLVAHGTNVEWLTYKVLVQYLHCLAPSCSISTWAGTSVGTLWDEEGWNGRLLLFIDGIWKPTVVQFLGRSSFTSCLMFFYQVYQVYLKVLLFLQPSPCAQDRRSRCLCLFPVWGGFCPLNVLDLSGNSHPSLVHSERLRELFRYTVKEGTSALLQRLPFILIYIEYFLAFFSTGFTHHCNAALLSRSSLNVIS